MIKERADELVAALRSGKYKQDHGQLRSASGYCYLGVACDISGLGKWEEWGSGRKSYNLDSDRYLASLPNPVQQHFGFKTAYGGSIPDEYDNLISLALLNDAGKTFFEIADFIEQNWEQL